jgi:2-polyprenyl-6-methoxyphenol hydroxylase-like FAD-dependent oxidoreductase
LPAWLAAIGARPPAEQLDDSGFVYYGRHFRSADGSIPPAFGALLQAYDSVSMLTLPADRGTWGVGVIASAKDADLRVLRDNARWEATVRSYPLIAHWLDGEPLDDVTVMAKLEDRHRDLVVDGTPVATGLVAIGDAWACTNPSLGRGISIGLMQAVAFRDVLAKLGTDDPVALVCAWAQATADHAEPWYQATLAFDRHRLAEIDAQIAGRPYEPGDPGWDLGQCLFAGAGADPDLLRGALGLGSLLVRPDELFADSAMADKVASVGGPLRGEPAPGPSRRELLSIVHA